MNAPIGFLEVVRQHPARVAVIDPDGTSMTFAELAARVNQISHALRAAGVVPGDRVVTVTPNSSMYHQLRLATGQIGVYFTPVSHHLTTNEIAHVIVDSGARLVISHADLVDVVAPAIAQTCLPPEGRIIAGGQHPGWRSLDAWLSPHPTTLPDQLTAGDYMGYTSGTTGRPKGVCKPLSGRPPRLSTFWQTMMGRLGIEAGPGVHLVSGPLYHSGPGTLSTNALQLGHTVVITERPRPHEILALIEHHKVSTLFTVPTVLRRLLRLPESLRASTDMSSLTSVVHAGAPCPADVKRGVIEWLGPIVYEFYGTTEGTATTVTSRQWLAHPGTVGEALPGITVAVLEEDGNPLPPGGIGEIYFTPPVPFVYLNDPEKTASAMRGALFSAGDLGYLDDDGWLFTTDRRTDMILSGGVNIYPAEVEGVLLEHRAVADVAVVGLPDDEWGQRLVAVVEADDGVATGRELAIELEQHARRQLAGFKVPRQFVFNIEVPRTSAGKLQRRVVRDILTDPSRATEIDQSIINTVGEVNHP